MNRIFLFLVLIYFASFQEAAKNVESRDYPDCDEITEEPQGVSDCVDRNLAYTEKNVVKYYDKCCFFKYLLNGETTQICVGLERDEVIDVIDYINLGEKEARKELRDIIFKKKRDGYLKVYSLDCEASFIKIFTLAFALLVLLF